MKEQEVRKLQEKANKESNPIVKKAIEDKIKELDKTVTK